MIFIDRFEATTMIKDILQACVFIGASLSVNGIEQGTITAINAEQADRYRLRVSGYSWLEVLSWECGTDSAGPFVRIGASVDYLITPIGETISVIELEATAPRDVCGNPLEHGARGKAVWCPD